MKFFWSLLTALFIFLYPIPYTLYHSLAATCLISDPRYGCEPAGLTQIEEMIQQVISIAVPLAFIILVAMLFIGGLKYLLSGGETKAINSATQTITWALLGILFLAIAWLILRLLEAFTGIPLTQFNIKVL